MALGDVTAAGTITVASGSSSTPAAGSHVDIATPTLGTVALQLTGTWTGTLVMEGIEAAGDPTAWVAAPTTTLAGAPITNLSANGIYLVNAAPFLIVRVRSTAWTSGSATVTLHGALATTGGAGGGGGGGAVTVADGSDAAEGATTDVAVQGDNPGTLSAKARGLNKSVAAGLPVTQQGAWSVGITGALPAGANPLGTVGVTSLPSLPTGANTIGAVTGPGAAALATDRTLAAAPFSTQLSDGAAFYVGAKTGQLPAALVGGNLAVVVNAALPTGANVIGAVTQSGTWNVTVNAALPTGANVIGAVTQSGTWNVTVNTALPTGANTIGAVTQASGPWTVQGAAAAGAAVSGNPVLLGMWDGTNVQYLKSDDTSHNNLRTALFNGATEAVVGGVMTSDASAFTNSGVLQVGAGILAYSGTGTNLDRFRTNSDATLLASAARTTTQTSADTVVYNAHSLMLTLDMTTVGTASVTVTINYKDPASGKYILLLSGAAITTNSTNVYTINPNIPAVANVTAQKDLGRVLQFVVTHNNANSGVYSQGLTLIS